MSYLESLMSKKRTLAVKEVLTDTEREELKNLDIQIQRYFLKESPISLTKEQQNREKQLAEEILTNQGG